MSWKDQRVLVTGASGFIGSHLVRRLVAEGAAVYAWAGSSAHLDRLADLQKKIRLSLVDIRNCDQVRAGVRDAKPDLVYHLAAYGVNYGEQDPVLAVDVNVRGTVLLLKALEEARCHHMVMAGTWAEYGSKDHPIREDEPLQPVGLYGATKAASTVVARELAAQQRLSLLVLRPFSVYGPGEGLHKFVPTVIGACLRGEQPKLTSCRQVRDYVFIEDVLEALLRAGAVSVEEPEAVNVGSGSPVALRAIAEAVMTHFPGIEPAFGAIPDRDNEIWSVSADIGRAKQLLDWRPAVSLEEGIRRTVEWYGKGRDGKA